MIMRGKYTYYLICLLMFCSCVNRKAESIVEAIKEKTMYEASFPESYRNIIQKYKEKKLPIIEKSIQINGGVFCLVNGIYSWKSFNERLQKDGYFVTLNQDSLSYFIFTESVSHIEGIYSNGGSATRIEKSVIALDISNEVAYILRHDNGGMPPNSIRRRRGSDVGALGRYMTDDDVYNFLITSILIKP